MVRMKGLEPPRLSAPEPKSGAATNYATSALILIIQPLQAVSNYLAPQRGIEPRTN